MVNGIEMTDEIRSKGIFRINDLETLKVIADPLRYQVMETLAHQPLTVKQVAEKLGLAASKLYYHVNLMEKHGLIRVVDTRIVSGIIEKRYQATTPNLDIDPALLSFTTETGKENINTLVVTAIDATREDILRSLQARAFELEQGAQAHPRQTILNRSLSRMPDARAEEFHERLKALVEEFDAADEHASSEDLQAYALTVAFYPSFYFREIEKGDSERNEHNEAT